VSNGLNKECHVISGVRPDDSLASGAHLVANIRAQEAERLSRQWRMD
jgi:hypothetical protein